MYEPKINGDGGTARAQVLPERERRSLFRIGILSFSSPGHFYPLTALGRRLQARGHEVVYFQVADLERSIRAAGLQFRQIGREDFPPARSARGMRKSASSRASPLCGAGFAASNGRP
jgi:Glycosyltransferase family 28 N-terminal domain